ncbi:MAG: tetratricopeptide repeat protein [Thaumarchaeota archaeon]|nr:tetratricopeptide repeat protein [Nitrososphaerota archaeon]
MTSKRKLHALTPEVMNQQLPDVFDALLYVEDLLQHKEDSHVTNYITIRLVTILEQFCRKVIEHKIENNEDSITVPTIIEIKTNDLDKIKKINKANVISISYNFPNIGTIDSTFNDYNIKNIWNNIDASIKKDLEELIYNRHNVVHTVSAISYDVKRGYDALEAFMKYICRDIFKTDNEFYYSKGYSLYKLKKFTQAIACFDKIISSNADNTLAYVWKGFTLLASGQSVEAIECFDKAIEIDPNNSFLHTHKGIVLATLGERIKAIECFDKAIEINPKDYFSYTNKGITLVELDKPAKAIEYFNKAIEINSRFSATHKAKGTALKMLGKYDEAERCYSVVNDLKKHEEDTVNIPVLFLPSL